MPYNPLKAATIRAPYGTMATVLKKILFLIKDESNCHVVNTGSKMIVGSTIINGEVKIVIMSPSYVSCVTDNNVQEFADIMNNEAPYKEFIQ